MIGYSSTRATIPKIFLIDMIFIKRFLLASGSLKEVAKLYGVTYPTVRVRLNKLIDKIKLAEDKTDNDD